MAEYTKEQIMDFGRRGLIKHLQTCDPHMSVNIKGYGVCRLNDLIFHLVANNKLGQQCVKELSVWDADLFINTMVASGLELETEFRESYRKRTEPEVKPEPVLRLLKETWILVIKSCLLPTILMFIFMYVSSAFMMPLLAAVCILLCGIYVYYIHEKKKYY